METTLHELLSVPGRKIFQRKDLTSFTTDAIVLADFAKPSLRCKSILDIGTGLAPIPLYLSLHTKAKIVGIDLDEVSCELAKASVELNGLSSQIEILPLDGNLVHKHFLPSTFDMVISNPPYFLDSLQASNPVRNRARHEGSLSLDGMILAAKRVLKSGGDLIFVHRAERLEDIIIALQKEDFHLKRLRYVYPKEGEEALLILVHTKLGGGSGSLKVMNPLWLRNSEGIETEEILSICRGRREQNGTFEKL
ncbi:MAG: methyltransferase [Candidatus Izemoplasmatales bacterium]|nr:methyltransferase [Candidatus Izemoplasmatales bacterium]